MPPYDDFTWREIQSQPEAWASSLTLLRDHGLELERLLKHNWQQVVFTGCGSTYYLSLAAAASFREITGRQAVGLPASEIWLSSQTALPGGDPLLLVAVSRSGETTETLRAVQAFREAKRGPVLTLSCYAGRALAGMGDANVVLTAAQEHSIAQTRAFSTLYIVTLYLAALQAGRHDLLAAFDGLPGACRAALDRSGPPARRLGHDAAHMRVFWLGSAARYGLACELSLKMKEMSLSDSEPFHFLEFRHGPQSMARAGALIVGLRGDANAVHEQAVLDEMSDYGASVIALGVDNADVVLDALPEAVRGPLYLPFGQLLAYERAVSRSLTPDRPEQLSAVVRLPE
jgi:glutamine---fructose-6-phosphate transaminase (isomerizing)